MCGVTPRRKYSGRNASYETINRAGSAVNGDDSTTAEQIINQTQYFIDRSKYDDDKSIELETVSQPEALWSNRRDRRNNTDERNWFVVRFWNVEVHENGNRKIKIDEAIYKFIQNHIDTDTHGSLHTHSQSHTLYLLTTSCDNRIKTNRTYWKKKIALQTSSAFRARTLNITATNAQNISTIFLTLKVYSDQQRFFVHLSNQRTLIRFLLRQRFCQWFDKTNDLSVS